ncbi:Guanylate kinase/L-type calcium channel beta subunit [Dillenia turbinata]|uniref:Guanylate kinase/L-type calcium channel beta subunit n=1 Tax=Dillenia turbinata TaxID=194707 RepID=A0AAN8Z8I8_9MAGN
MNALSKDKAGQRSSRLLSLAVPRVQEKGRLISKLMEKFPYVFKLSISHTSRAPGKDEKDAVHYHFPDINMMDEEIKECKFLEYNSVHSNLFRTSIPAVQLAANAGNEVDGKTKIATSHCSSAMLKPEKIKLFCVMHVYGGGTETGADSKIAVPPNAKSFQLVLRSRRVHYYSSVSSVQEGNLSDCTREGFLHSIMAIMADYTCMKLYSEMYRL